MILIGSERINGIDYVVHLGRVNLTEDRFQNHLQK